MRNCFLMMMVCCGAALGAVGCADDAASGGNGALSDTGGSDAGAGAPVADADQDDTLDVALPPDGSVREDVGPPDAGGGDGIVPGSDTGAPDADDAGMEPDVEQVECAYPSTDPNCPQGDYGPASFIDTIYIVPQQSCCRDFDGDGSMDNQLGMLMSLASLGGGPDVNTQIALAIQQGRLAYLLEFARWGNPTTDPSLDARFLMGAEDGAGGYHVKPESFDTSGTALYGFGSAKVEQGVLFADEGTLALEFPGLLPQVEIVLQEVRIESADVVLPADLTAAGQVTLENGKMSALMDRDDLFDSLNVAANACGCLGKDAFAWDGSKWRCELGAADESACANDVTASGGCQQLASQQLCGLLSTLSRSTDIDVDEDGSNDAYSIGIEFHGSGASISGPLP